MPILKGMERTPNTLPAEPRTVATAPSQKAAALARSFKAYRAERAGISQPSSGGLESRGVEAVGESAAMRKHSSARGSAMSGPAHLLFSEPARYSLKLRSVGNPDFGQYAPISNPVTVHAATLEEVAALAEAYRDFWSLGGGNWTSPFIMEGKRKVAKISYNGRLWGMDGKEIGVAAPSAEVMERIAASVEVA